MPGPTATSRERKHQGAVCDCDLFSNFFPGPLGLVQVFGSVSPLTFLKFYLCWGTKGTIESRHVVTELTPVTYHCLGEADSPAHGCDHAHSLPCLHCSHACAATTPPACPPATVTPTVLPMAELDIPPHSCLQPSGCHQVPEKRLTGDC